MVTGYFSCSLWKADLHLIHFFHPIGTNRFLIFVGDVKRPSSIRTTVRYWPQRKNYQTPFSSLTNSGKHYGFLESKKLAIFFWYVPICDQAGFQRPYDSWGFVDFIPMFIRYRWRRKESLQQWLSKLCSEVHWTSAESLEITAKLLITANHNMGIPFFDRVFPRQNCFSAAGAAYWIWSQNRGDFQNSFPAKILVVNSSFPMECLEVVLIIKSCMITAP